MTDVTVCPAAPAHILLAQEPMFNRRALPVSARFTGHDDFVSTGLAFDDYHRMQSFTVKTHKRRNAVPTWNDGQLQEILCVALEQRAGIYEVPKSMTRLQRLEAAHQRLLARRDGLSKALDAASGQYLKLRAAGLPTREVEAKFQMYDAQLSMLPRLPAVLCAVIYLSYRLGFTSPQVAHQLRVSPVFVRQVLSRIRTTAAKIERGESGVEVDTRKRRSKKESPSVTGFVER
jgi:hypothetical protein